MSSVYAALNKKFGLFESDKCHLSILMERKENYLAIRMVRIDFYFPSQRTSLWVPSVCRWSCLFMRPSDLRTKCLSVLWSLSWMEQKCMKARRKGGRSVWGITCCWLVIIACNKIRVPASSVLSVLSVLAN